MFIFQYNFICMKEMIMKDMIILNSQEIINIWGQDDAI